MNPTISVITATYNWSNVLKVAITSVLRQTFSNFEMLVIGDHCTDDSQQVVESFNDPRVKWHNLATNSGCQCVPNNYGIEVSQGEYVAYLGHDDVWHPNHLELLFSAICKANAEVGSSVCVSLGPDSGPTRYTNKIKIYGFEKKYFIPPSAQMHKKSIYETIGRWKDYKDIKTPPDHELQNRWLSLPYVSSNRLTTFKFNSAWRKNSYIEKPCHQQLEYLDKMSHSTFFEEEMAAICRRLKVDTNKESLKVWLNRHPDHNTELRHHSHHPNGWDVSNARKYRGLE